MDHSNLKNANILIVDDKQANVDLLTGFLEDEGYANYTSTTDSREVTELFKEFKPDLMLLDLHMPHLSGFQVMEQLNGLIPEDDYLPILVLTADATTETKLKALAAGAKDFLSKPFDLTEVELRINNLLLTRSIHVQLKDQNLILEEKVLKRTRQLNEAREKAEASDRLKTAFLNNISHELRTPLNGILGFGQIIIDPDLTMDEKEENLKMLNLSSDRLLETINNYMEISLLVSNNQSVKVEEVNTFELMNNLYDSFSPECEAKGIKMTLDINETDDILLDSDRGLLRKAMSHLIMNSIKFTEKGSVSIGYKQENEQVIFYIKDTGIGMDKESKSKIFNIFTQVDNSNTRTQQGSGLGLSIAKGCIELLGGKIDLESEKNKGTILYLSLPLIAAT